MAPVGVAMQMTFQVRLESIIEVDISPEEIGSLFIANTGEVLAVGSLAVREVEMVMEMSC